MHSVIIQGHLTLVTVQKRQRETQWHIGHIPSPRSNVLDEVDQHRGDKTGQQTGRFAEFLYSVMP